MASHALIDDYLYYGYVPGLSYDSIHCSPLDNNNEYPYTPHGASELLDAVVDRLLPSSLTDGHCIVPLSGGWDSRILFGCAIERFGRSRIKAVSFGCPGQLDYELGRVISDGCGVEHYAFDLSSRYVTWDDLEDSVRTAPWTYVPDSFYNRTSIDLVATGPVDIVISGFMGDPLTGGHLSPSSSMAEALEKFVFSQRRSRTHWLPSPGYDPKKSLPHIPEVSGFDYYDLFDLYLRQASCIAPIVSPVSGWQPWSADLGRSPKTGASVIAPFSDREWASYWINAPIGLKKSQDLYLSMLRYKFPRLFNYPSKSTYGIASEAKAIARLMSTRVRVQSFIDNVFPKLGYRYRGSLNYLDYAHAFRHRDDYLVVLSRSIDYLKQNNFVPWLNLDEIVKDHLNYKANHEDALLILIGLAINLSADQAQCPP